METCQLRGIKPFYFSSSSVTHFPEMTANKPQALREAKLGLTMCKGSGRCLQRALSPINELELDKGARSIAAHRTGDLPAAAAGPALRPSCLDAVELCLRKPSCSESLPIFQIIYVHLAIPKEANCRYQCSEKAVFPGNEMMLPHLFEPT